jgi:hypothetical protein
MAREEKIQHLIEKVILKKFPFLVNVEVVDLFNGDTYFDFMGGYSYVANFETDKCLSTEEMEMVDTEVKVLFRMMSIVNKNQINKKETEIRCFFDCGDGEGFNFSGSLGYQH